MSGQTDSVAKRGFRRSRPARRLRICLLPSALYSSLIAPRRVTLAGSVNPQGGKLDADAVKKTFEFVSRAYALHKAESNANVLAEVKADEIAASVVQEPRTK